MLLVRPRSLLRTPVQSENGRDNTAGRKYLVVRPPGTDNMFPKWGPAFPEGSAPTSVGAGVALLTVSSTTPLVLRVQRVDPCAGTGIEPVGRAT